ncbi:MAG: nucleoside deaminase [Desulfovibrio sp.]|nr:nucleoside deaminase [Desulfovibrio sp.]
MRDMPHDIVDEVRKSAIELREGGPFGAVVYKDGRIVGKGVNRVTSLNDPTAHAEIVDIRDACRRLQTYDLSGCELYATGYPCPMCMSAIIWANIKKVYYSCDYEDAARIGFRDEHIFRFLQGGCADAGTVSFERVEKAAVLELYEAFTESRGTLY